MLLLAVSSLSLGAEVTLQHTCRGYFTVDRWGQGVLHHGPHHLFVAESALQEFQAHRGKPVKVVVSNSDKPADAGAGLIMRAKEVVEADLGYAKGLQVSPVVKDPKVAKGEGVSIWYTLTNSSGESIKIQPHGYGTLSLAAVLVTNSPECPGPVGDKADGSRAYWDHTFARAGLKPGAKPFFVACHEITLKETVVLKLKEVHEKTVTVGKELPVGEYEVFVYVKGRLADRGLGPTSKRVSFDVVEVGADDGGGLGEGGAAPEEE